MVKMGGENPYETEYNKNVADDQSKLEDVMTVNDGIKKGSDDEGAG